MPQMAPMNWFILFFIFIFLYILMSMKIYFSNLNNPMSNNKMNYINSNNKNWKW